MFVLLYITYTSDDDDDDDCTSPSAPYFIMGNWLTWLWRLRSPDLLSTTWNPRRADGVSFSLSPKSENQGIDDVPVHGQEKTDVPALSVRSRERERRWERENFPFLYLFLLFTYTLSGLAGVPSKILSLGKVNLIHSVYLLKCLSHQKHAHRHTQI